MIEVLATVGLFALVATKLVDFARNAFDPGDFAPKWFWIGLAVGIGVAIAHVWDLNVLPALTHAQSAGGRWLTGIGIGAAAGGWHEVLDTLSGFSKQLHTGSAPRQGHEQLKDPEAVDVAPSGAAEDV